MNRILQSTCAILFALYPAFHASPASAGTKTAPPPLSCHHIPQSRALADRPLRLEFVIAPMSQLASARVIWRPADGGPWRQVPIELASTGRMLATLPASAMTDPGVVYYVSLSDGSGQEVLAFASESEPHRLVVRGDAGLVRRELAHMELQGLLSELELHGQWVDFHTLGGDPSIGADYRDSTVRFRHWLLGGVEYIEFGVGTLRGRAPPSTLPGLQPKNRVAIGFDRGWSQIGFRLGERVGAYGRVLLGGDEQTFRAGVAGGLRIGRPRQTRLNLETGVTGGVGAHLLAAFHVHTIHRWPVAVEVQLDNLPNAGAEVAERVRLRLGHEIDDNWVAEAVGTYQAQRHDDHGFGAGARLTHRF